jgi:hypothetical protein
LRRSLRDLDDAEYIVEVVEGHGDGSDALPRSGDLREGELAGGDGLALAIS